MRLPWWFPFGRVPEIAPHDLHAALANGTPPQLVDVRSAAEYAQGHIAGAVSIPITEFRQRLPSLGLDPARPVVAICLTAHRSVPAVRHLQRSGFRDVSQLAGGMLAWQAHRLPKTGG